MNEFVEPLGECQLLSLRMCQDFLYDRVLSYVYIQWLYLHWPSKHCLYLWIFCLKSRSGAVSLGLGVVRYGCNLSLARHCQQSDTFAVTIRNKCLKEKLVIAKYCGGSLKHIISGVISKCLHQKRNNSLCSLVLWLVKEMRELVKSAAYVYPIF